MHRRASHGYIGRPARIGQHRPERWTIFVVRNGFSTYRESAMTHRLQLLIYEAVRVTSGQITNKYIWEVFEPHVINRFSSRNMVWLAHVYSRIAHLLLRRCRPQRREVEWMISWVPYYIVPKLYMRAVGPGLDRLEDMREKMMSTTITIVEMAANRSQAPKAKNVSPFTFNGDPLPIRRRDTDEPVNGTVEFTAWALAQLEASWGGKTLSLALQKKVGRTLFNTAQFCRTLFNSVQLHNPTNAANSQLLFNNVQLCSALLLCANLLI